MFFQFSPPKPVPKTPVIKKETQPEETVLSLAPFTPNPKIFFENIKIGQTVTETLVIKNPTNNHVQLRVCPNFGDELDVQLSWTEQTVERNAQTTLEISWTPNVAGAWRHMLHLSDKRCIQRDIPIVFKSVSPGKKKVAKTKYKKMPTFVSKKTKSPVQKLARKRSPLKRPVLPDISNIPTFQFDVVHGNGFVGKENGAFANFQFQSEIRRETFVVGRPTLNEKSPAFEDSLEMQSPLPRSDASFEKRLQSDSFNISEVATPKNHFMPEHCSTDEKSFNNTSSIQARPLCLFPQNTNTTFEILLEEVNMSGDALVMSNVSTETYVKENLSSETFTKADLSSNTFVKDDSYVDAELSLTPSQKARHDGLAGFSVKETIEADLWSNRKNRRLLTIKEEQSDSSTVPTALSFSLKRKSDFTFTTSPTKKPNLGSQRIFDWSKRGDVGVRVAKKTSGLMLGKNSISETRTSEVIVTNPFLVSGDPFLTESFQRSDSWVSLQEENFKKWLNSLLTSPLEEEDMPTPDVAKLWSECKNREVEIAPSREAVADKFHTSIQWNVLRKKATNLYKSDQIKSVLGKVCKAIDLKKIAIRDDRNIHLVLHLQTQIMNVFLSYNPLWLRLALETVYNQTIPVTSNSDYLALTSFISSRFMKDPLLLKRHKSPYAPKYVCDLKKSMLKRFFSLVFFLDQAKKNKLIRHDPCLFRKTSQIKESREALLKFSRESLHAVGDITKYLRYFDYVVSYKQTYIHEFDYGVHHLGVDLRDGVRLTRVLEIILLRNDLTNLLRVPAISRLQKVHNMKLVFETLANAGFEIHYDISPKDVVDGHKEKTLSFLWQLIYKFQTPLMVKSATTIQHWWRTECLSKREELKRIRAQKNAAAAVIQAWWRRRLLAAKLEWFVRMREYYLTSFRILERATITIQKYYRMYKCRKHYTTLLRTIVAIQIHARRWLKTRLLAAIKIQSTVRMFLATRRLQKLKRCVVFLEDKYLSSKLMVRQKHAFEGLKWAALVVQRRFRARQLGNKLRQEFEVLKCCTVLIQRRFRANQLMRQDCGYYSKLKSSTIVVQRRFRATKEMRVVNAQYVTLKWAAIIIQQRYRARKLAQNQRLEFVVFKNSAVVIQRWYRSCVSTRNHVVCYNDLKRVTVTIQRWFRATRDMRQEMERYNTRKAAAIQIQRFYRSVCLMRSARMEYEVLRQTVVMIQTRYRAKLLARSTRQCYNTLKQAVVCVQRRRRAQLVMRVQRNDFKSLKDAAVVVQRLFRARLVGRLHRQNYIKLREAVVLIQARRRLLLETRHAMRSYAALKTACVVVQRRFRARRLMILERTKYNRFRATVVFVQRQRRAMMEMRIQKKQFEELKAATVTIQRRFRAQLLAREQRGRFNQLKQAVVLVQRRWRTKLESRRFQTLKTATITIQRRFRANAEANRVRTDFNNFKKLVIVVQRKWRATLAMRRAMNEFNALKRTVLVIQRRFRARTCGRDVRCRFKQEKEAIVRIQKWWRGILLMRIASAKFQELKAATVNVQRRFRAKLSRRLEMDRFQRLRQAVVCVQRKRRSLVAMRVEVSTFLVLKTTTLMVQRRFRANRAAKLERDRFVALKNAVVVVQNKWRAKLEMRVDRHKFQTLRTMAIYVQRRFRANRAGRLQREVFIELKRMVIIVQKQWRAKLLMRIEMHKLRAIRTAAVNIQRRFRARQLARIERERFEKTKNAVVFVQKTWRNNRIVRNQKTIYSDMKKSALCIQKWARGFLVRRKFAELLTAEAVAERRLLRLKNKAAVKLQSVWRGYRVRRSSNTPGLLDIRNRLQRATDEAVPSKTITSRCGEAILKLTSGISVYEVIATLEILEYFTRVDAKSCLKLSTFLPKHLYLTIHSTNRSPPELSVCTAAASILINFYRYEPTRIYSFVGEYMENLLTVMLHSCNKEAPLFPTIATLIWLFAHDEDCKSVIVSSPKFQQKIERIRFLCHRQKEMVAKCKPNYESLFLEYRSLPLPYMRPDWGLEIKNKPKIFRNSVQAVNCLLDILGCN